MKRQANIEHLEKGKYYDATFKCDCGGGHSQWEAIVRVDGLSLNTPATAELMIVDTDEGAVQAGFSFAIYESDSRWAYGPKRDPITFKTVAMPEEPEETEATQVAASRLHSLYGSRLDHNPVLGYEALLQKYSDLLPKEPCPKCGAQLVVVTHPFHGVECSMKDTGSCDFEQEDQPGDNESDIKAPPQREDLGRAFGVGASRLSYIEEEDGNTNVGETTPGSELPDPRYSADGAMEQSAVTDDSNSSLNDNADGGGNQNAPQMNYPRASKEAEIVQGPWGSADEKPQPKRNHPSNPDWEPDEGPSRDEAMAMHPSNQRKLKVVTERVIRRARTIEAAPNPRKPRNKGLAPGTTWQPGGAYTPPKEPAQPSKDWARPPSTDLVLYKDRLPTTIKPPEQPKSKPNAPMNLPPADPKKPDKKKKEEKPKPPVNPLEEHEKIVRQVKQRGPFQASRVIRRAAGPKRIVPKDPAQKSEPNPAVTEETSLIPDQGTKTKTWKEKSLLPGHERGQRKDPNNKIPRNRKHSTATEVSAPRNGDADQLNFAPTTTGEAIGRTPVVEPNDAVHAGSRIFNNELDVDYYLDKFAAMSQTQVCPECGNVSDPDDDDGTTFDADGLPDDVCAACGAPLTQDSHMPYDGSEEPNDEETEGDERESDEPDFPNSLPSLASIHKESMEDFFGDESSGGSASDDEMHHFMMANLQSLVATGMPSVPLTTMGPEWSEDVEPTNDDGSYGRPRVTSSASADTYIDLL